MALKFPIIPKSSYSFEEEANHRTLISQFENGDEQRRAKWSQDKKIFSLKYNALYREKMLTLWQFYQLCRGAQKEFDFVNPRDSDLPYDQVTAYWPLHEGESTKLNDWNGFIYPTYKCRFIEDRLSREEFSYRITATGLKLYQVSPIIYTNNYGTLSGGYSWVESPDGTACIDFNGSTGQASMGDPSALDPGQGTFHLPLRFMLILSHLKLAFYQRKQARLPLPLDIILSSPPMVRLRSGFPMGQLSIQLQALSVPSLLRPGRLLL